MTIDDLREQYDCDWLEDKGQFSRVTTSPEEQFATYKVLLEVVERLEYMQQICGELTTLNPFLAYEFQRNKTSLEKLA